MEKVKVVAYRIEHKRSKMGFILNDMVCESEILKEMHDYHVHNFPTPYYDGLTHVGRKGRRHAFLNKQVFDKNIKQKYIVELKKFGYRVYKIEVEIPKRFIGNNQIIYSGHYVKLKIDVTDELIGEARQCL